MARSVVSTVTSSAARSSLSNTSPLNSQVQQTKPRPQISIVSPAASGDCMLCDWPENILAPPPLPAVPPRSRQGPVSQHASCWRRGLAEVPCPSMHPAGGEVSPRSRVPACILLEAGSRRGPVSQHASCWRQTAAGCLSGRWPQCGAADRLTSPSRPSASCSSRGVREEKLGRAGGVLTHPEWPYAAASHLLGGKRKSLMFGVQKQINSLQKVLEVFGSWD